MTIISFNKELVHPAYAGIINQMEAGMADKFYEKIKNLNKDFLKSYEETLLPKNFFDRLDFAFSDKRRIRLAAVKKVFYEDKENLKSKSDRIIFL